jgi:hypothetical protein
MVAPVGLVKRMPCFDGLGVVACRIGFVVLEKCEAYDWACSVR